MMKWLMVFFAMFALVSPCFAVGVNAGSSSWGSVSNQVASSWDQVREVGQSSSVNWGGSTITASDPRPRCRRICRRDCEAIISEICYGDGVCRTVVKFLCNTFCEVLCDDLYP
jgi:hypothetical protein